uniref:Uncharacterized protein n=1 Tax=Arundo donax TaxID=35708 RepID=A0A0A9FAT2_ARUDO
MPLLFTLHATSFIHFARHCIAIGFHAYFFPSFSIYCYQLFQFFLSY